VVDNPPHAQECFDYYKTKEDYGFNFDTWLDNMEAGGWTKANGDKLTSWKKSMSTWQGSWVDYKKPKWSEWDKYDNNQVWHMCDIDKNQAACVEYSRRRAFVGTF
jgi:hypothetical protein